MGGTRHEREVARARAAYIAAALEVARAERDAAAVRIDPGVRHPQPWTAEEYAAVARCARAWRQLHERRRGYESTLREQAGR